MWTTLVLACHVSCTSPQVVSEGIDVSHGYPPAPVRFVFTGNIWLQLPSFLLVLLPAASRYLVGPTYTRIVR